jgi:hypothetical protein
VIQWVTTKNNHKRTEKIREFSRNKKKAIKRKKSSIGAAGISVLSEAVFETIFEERAKKSYHKNTEKK